MNFIRQNWKGLLLCLVLAAPASLFGKQFPIIGGPVFAILGGMIFEIGRASCRERVSSPV